MRVFKQKGKYKQIIEIIDGKIISLNCTCLWHSLYPNNWKSGDKICRHLKDAIKEFMEQKLKRKLDKKGYVLIYKPDHTYSKTKNGWIKEHRAVIEDFLGRRLINPECIHHIDFCKENNTIENLMVFKNHNEHSKFHQQLKQFGWTNPLRKQVEERWQNLKKEEKTLSKDTGN